MKYSFFYSASGLCILIVRQNRSGAMPQLFLQFI